MTFLQFLFDALTVSLRGGRNFWRWMALLGATSAIGIYAYSIQFERGILATSGLSEEVAWGIYIANFAFLIGIAAAAVMLVIPAYIFNNKEIKQVVLIGEAMAISACLMAVMFILASLGRPDRLWHILPLIGRMNFPRSMLAWDVVVINFYLFLNIVMFFTMLYTNYKGSEPYFPAYFLGVLVAILVAISIHTVTAFLFSSNVSRPYWHSAILGPRFLASAFTSGPALIILALQFIRNNTRYLVDDKVIETLAIIMTVTLQINMFLLAVEMYTEFYSQTRHASSIQYLFFGFKGYSSLVPWIWTSIALNLVAVLGLSIHPIRRNRMYLNVACVFTITGIWIEKGMGLVIPGFIPTPLGDIVEYIPTHYEIGVCLGIWSIGTILFTLLVRSAIPIQLGDLSRLSRQIRRGGSRRIRNP